MALTTKQRDALPASDFAVPETRDLPMHDKIHVRMAWNMVDKTKGLSEEQRASARRRILRRAHQLGIDTSEWHLQAMSFSAMALEFPEGANEDHVNKLPFEGILTLLDVPSDKPLFGTGGKCVIVPTEVAESAMASLLGMAIDFTPDFDGHSPRNKIGIITSAEAEDGAIQIKGYFFAVDFPVEVQRIQTEKDKLGFSFEARSLMQSMKADPLVVSAIEFTGAAVLYKDKAAYTETSISAKADQEENDMTPEQETQLKALGDAVTGFPKLVSEAITAAIAASAAKQPLSAASVGHMVSTHCAALRNCAAGMAAAGIGNHPTEGHVAHLNRMADRMEAAAAMGQLPHIYRDHDYLSGAAADPATVAKANAESMTAAITAATKPLTDMLAGLETQVKDLKTGIAANAEPNRKTLSPSVGLVLERLGLSAGAEKDKKFKVVDLDAAAKKAGLARTDSMALKLALKDANLLEAA